MGHGRLWVPSPNVLLAISDIWKYVKLQFGFQQFWLNDGAKLGLQGIGLLR